MGTRSKVIPAVSERTVTEVVITVTHDLINKDISVTTGYWDTDKIEKGSTRMAVITGTGYTEFMAANPSWASDKPAERLLSEDFFNYFDYVVSEGGDPYNRKII
jgi:hypothetical protein